MERQSRAEGDEQQQVVQDIDPAVLATDQAPRRGVPRRFNLAGEWYKGAERNEQKAAQDEEPADLTAGVSRQERAIDSRSLP
jgi:hypothetical protein